jgi:hypothetical protein
MSLNCDDLTGNSLVKVTGLFFFVPTNTQERLQILNVPITHFSPPIYFECLRILRDVLFNYCLFTIHLMTLTDNMAFNVTWSVINKFAGI